MALVQIAGQNYQVSPSGRVTDSSNNVVTNANLIATARAQAASPRLNRRLNTDSLAVGANTGILQAVEDAKRSRGFSRKPKYIGMDQGLSSALDPYVRDPQSSAASNIASFLGRGFGRGTGEVLDVIGEGLGVAGEEITDFFTKPVGSGVEYDVLYNTPEGVDLANISGSGVGRPVIGSTNPRAVLTPEGSTGSKPIPTLANLMGTGEEEQFYGDGQSELVDLFSSFGVPDAIRDGQPSVASDTVKDVIESDIAKPKSEPEETKLSNLMGEKGDLQFTGTEQQGADTGEINAGSGATTDGGKSGEQINQDLYQGLLDQSLKSYNEAVGMAPPEAQTMQQYKDEFSKATGIDISGDPDNKAALTAFGLALMQNKAGKGFNVGRMLSEVGAAGEKALPLMEQARREAREAQVAAGKYALTEGKTATANRQKFLVDQAKYLRDRRDTILGAQVTRINQIEDREDKQEAAASLASAKNRYDTAVKEIEWRQDAEKTIAEGKEIKNMLKQEPISGNKQYVIHKGMPKAGGQLVLTDAQNDAKKFGRGYGNILEAQNTIDNSIRILREIEASPMGSTAESLVESTQSLFKSLVPQNPNDKMFEDIAIYNTDGSITLKQGISKEALLESMRNGIISEYKRFLTQETGNGISEGDVERINQLLGKPGAFKNIAEAIAGLEEARGIFDVSKVEFEDSLSQFTDRTNYDNDEAFNLGSAAAQQGIFYGIGNRGNNYQAIDFSKLPVDDASGLPVFDLTK